MSWNRRRVLEAGGALAAVSATLIGSRPVPGREVQAPGEPEAGR
jgi:hypothetical protein